MNRSLLFALAVLAGASPLAAEPLSRAEAVRLALEANPDVKKAAENLASLRGLVTETRADALPDIKVYRAVDALPRPFAAEQPQLRQLPSRVPREPPAGAGHDLGRLRGAQADALQLQDRQGHQGLAPRHPVGPRGDPAGAAGGGAPGACRPTTTTSSASSASGWRARPSGRRRSSSRPRGTAGRREWPPTSTSCASRWTSRTRGRRLLRAGGPAELSRGRLNAVLVRPIGQPIEPTDDLPLPRHGRAARAGAGRGLGPPARGAAGGPRRAHPRLRGRHRQGRHAPEPRVQRAASAGRARDREPLPERLPEVERRVWC